MGPTVQWGTFVLPLAIVSSLPHKEWVAAEYLSPLHNPEWTSKFSSSCIPNTRILGLDPRRCRASGTCLQFAFGGPSSAICNNGSYFQMIILCRVGRCCSLCLEG